MTHVSTGATYESLVDMALLHEEDKGKKEVNAEVGKQTSRKAGKTTNPMKRESVISVALLDI